MSMASRAARAATIVLALTTAVAKASAEGDEGVRVVWSFEKNETARSLPQFGFWGEPTPIRYPEPGWRGKPIGPDHAGDVTAIRKASSRNYPLMTLTVKNATHRQYCYRYDLDEKLAARIAAWVKKTPGGTACPPARDYHDLVDWYWQRCGFSRYLWRHAPAEGNWSNFDRLRFDVLSARSRVTLGVKIRDRIAAEGRPARHPHGLRTPAMLFNLPAGKPVTCDVPLAAAARACELDLKRIHRYHIRINGVDGPTELYLDNVRLVSRASAATEAKLPLLAMEGEVRPWGRPVVFEGHTARDGAALKRELGPVGSLGPVVVTNSPGSYASAPGHFGGTGVTYFQSTRRSCVAYDNKRLLVVIGGGPAKARLMSKSVGEGGGVWALGSFDGGKTWGGVAPGQAEPARYGNWYWRGNLYSDRNGDVYWLGTQNCDSYHEGYDMLFRRLAMVGPGWKADRVAVVDQNGYKCPAWASVIRTDSGRLWAAWRDGFGGSYAKCSDDDGFTWLPCKDASAAPPRPPHEPDLADLAKPADRRPPPPKQVLLWPAEGVCGEFLLPYKGQVALIAADGGKWQVHDGRRWSPPEPGPFGKVRKARGIISCSILGADQPFVSRFEVDKLSVARRVAGEWQVAHLDSGQIMSNILSASGDAMYCFYIRKNGEAHEVISRRFKAGKWAPAVKLAVESAELNQVAAPMFCPSGYAAVFWDQRVTNRRKPTFVKFMRVANE